MVKLVDISVAALIHLLTAFYTPFCCAVTYSIFNHERSLGPLFARRKCYYGQAPGGKWWNQSLVYVYIHIPIYTYIYICFIPAQ